MQWPSKPFNWNKNIIAVILNMQKRFFLCFWDIVRRSQYLHYTAVCGRMAHGWNGKDLEERDRRDTIPAFYWRGWGTLRKSSVKITDVPVETWTEHLPNASLQRYRCASSFEGRESRNKEERTRKERMKQVRKYMWNIRILAQFEVPAYRYVSLDSDAWIVFVHPHELVR
jgi:hypothetical protein